MSETVCNAKPDDTRVHGDRVSRFAASRTPAPMDVGRLLLVSAIRGGASLCIEIALADCHPVARAAWHIRLTTAIILPICHRPGLKSPHRPAQPAAVSGHRPTAIASVLRTRIVQLNGAVFMSSAGYLIALFAVFRAFLFVQRVPDVQTRAALVLILSGMAVGRSARH